MANILIVDDAAFMRLTIRKIMEPEGHTIVAEAATGIEAVEKFAMFKPDVTILDITMPEMNGIEALKRIKILDPKAKIVICTAMGQKSMVAKAVELGAEEFIVKPFENKDLIAAVKKVMAKTADA